MQTYNYILQINAHFLKQLVNESKFEINWHFLPSIAKYDALFKSSTFLKPIKSIL